MVMTNDSYSYTKRGTVRLTHAAVVKDKADKFKAKTANLVICK